MRLTCPACNSENSLEVLIGREADARAVAGFLERHLPLGEAMLRYIALFRPAKRRLGLARMVALVEELMPDIERHAIDRKGREWRCEPRAWRAAFDTVVAARDKGTLQLPLTSHGYLYEVLVGLAEKAEAQAEQLREQQRQRSTEMRTTSGPRDLGGMARSVGESLAIAPGAAAEPAPAVMVTRAPQPPAGPSPAAREIQAQIAAARARSQPAGEDQP